MGGRGAKSSRNSFTREGGGGAREASANPEAKPALAARDQASAEEMRYSMYDLGKDAEGSAMQAVKTNSLAEAKANIGYAKANIAEHEKMSSDIRARFNPTKEYMRGISADLGKAKANIRRAEAKVAAGGYTQP